MRLGLALNAEVRGFRPLRNSAWRTRSANTGARKAKTKVVNMFDSKRDDVAPHPVGLVAHGRTRTAKANTSGAGAMQQEVPPG